MIPLEADLLPQGDVPDSANYSDGRTVYASYRDNRHHYSDESSHSGDVNGDNDDTDDPISLALMRVENSYFSTQLTQVETERDKKGCEVLFVASRESCALGGSTVVREDAWRRHRWRLSCTGGDEFREYDCSNLLATARDQGHDVFRRRPRESS
jgi:hypothetical protein